MKLSFVIPTKNRPMLLSTCVNLIHENMSFLPHEYEIILVDNSTNEETKTIFSTQVEKFLSMPGRVTVSLLRNEAVKIAKGDIIVFIDDDVWLSPTWGKNLDVALKYLQNDYKAVVGSLYGIDEKNPSWIDKAWYKSLLSKKKVTALCGGHMIITRKLFDELQGFNPSLETGEDTDICLRAEAYGGCIVNIPQLKVVHKGNPNNVIWFFNRERWHGKGNFSSAFFFNKLTLLTLMLLISLIVTLIGSLIFAPLILFYPISSLILSLPLAVKHVGNSYKYFPHAVVLSWLTLTARGISLFDVLVEKVQKLKYSQELL